jgi:hypothetical protein
MKKWVEKVLVYKRVFILGACFIFFILFSQTPAWGKEENFFEASIPVSSFLKTVLPAKTETLFKTENVTETQTLPFSTQYEETDELEIGEEQIKQAGINGMLTQTFQVEYYNGVISNKELLTSERENPIPQNISNGTKIIWRTFET